MIKLFKLYLLNVKFIHNKKDNVVKIEALFINFHQRKKKCLFTIAKDVKIAKSSNMLQFTKFSMSILKNKAIWKNKLILPTVDE